MIVYARIYVYVFCLYCIVFSALYPQLFLNHLFFSISFMMWLRLRLSCGDFNTTIVRFDSDRRLLFEKLKKKNNNAKNLLYYSSWEETVKIQDVKNANRQKFWIIYFVAKSWWKPPHIILYSFQRKYIFKFISPYSIHKTTIMIKLFHYKLYFISNSNVANCFLTNRFPFFIVLLPFLYFLLYKTLL